MCLFNEKIARNYDSWYESKKGKYCDGLEKNLMWKLIKPAFGESLLDIGCGTGHHLRWFRSWGLKVAGIDNSPYMLQVARRNLGDEVKLELADAENLPFRPEQFDIVCMITTLEFLDDLKLVLKEALRVSKNRAFLGVLNKYSSISLKRRLKGIIFSDPIWGYARFFSVRELLKLIKGLDESSKRPRAIRGENLEVGWETCIPNSDGRNPFGAFIGVLIKKA